jgi:site-specific DNA-cytosine methylase
MDETETLDEFPPPPSLDELLMYGQIQQFEPDVLAGAVKRWRDDVRSYGESKMRDSDPHRWFRGNTMLDNDVQGTLDQLRESARTAGAGEDVTESDAFRINSVRTKIVPLKSDSGMILGDFEAQSRHDGGGLDLLLRVDNKDEAERAEIRTIFDFGMGRKVSEDTVDRSKRKALSIPAVTDDDIAAAIEAAKAEAAWQRKKEADYTEIANVSDRSQPAGDIYGAPNPNGAIGRRNAEIARIKAQEQEYRAYLLAKPLSGPRILLEERVKEAVKADPDLAGSIGTVDLGEDFWRGLQQTRLGTRMAIADAMGDEDVKADVRQAIADLPLSYPGSTRLNYNGGLGSFISDGSAVLGGMAPTVATALVGGPLGAAGGASSAIVRTAAMAPLSASAYGNSYAGMLNEADAMEAKGNVAGAAQRRKDARSKAWIDAIIETGSELIFAEEMVRIAGKTFLRKVAKGAASNTIEEFVAAVGGAESNLAFRDEVTTSGEIARQSALGAFAGGFMQVPAGIVQVILPARPTQDGDAPLESPGDSAVINIDGRTFALQQVGDLAGQWMEAGRDGDGNIANTPLNPETDADVIAQLEEVRGRLNQGEMPEADIPEMDDAPVRPLINDFVDEDAAIAKADEAIANAAASVESTLQSEQADKLRTGDEETPAMPDLADALDQIRVDRIGEVAEQTITEAELTASPIETSSVDQAANRDVELFPDTTDFGGKLNTEVVLGAYSEKDGIGTATYVNPQNGSEDVFLSAFGGNDFIGYIRIYDEAGNPTNRFASKLERRSIRDGATRAMMDELQARLPKGHEYTEDVSVSTDGLNFISSQLNKGYELVTGEDGKPTTNRVAINGESITNPLGDDVLREGGAFQDIQVTNQAQFERVRLSVLPYLQKFGNEFTADNIYWENGRVYIDMPVLRKKDTVPEEGPPTAPPEPTTAEGTPAETSSNKEVATNLIKRAAEIDGRKDAWESIPHVPEIRDGMVILYRGSDTGRFTESSSGLEVKSKGDLVNTSERFGEGAGIPLTMYRAVAEPYGEVAEFHIPVNEYLKLHEKNDAALGNWGEQEVVLSPAAAKKYIQTSKPSAIEAVPLIPSGMESTWDVVRGIALKQGISESDIEALLDFKARQNGGHKANASESLRFGGFGGLTAKVNDAIESELETEPGRVSMEASKMKNAFMYIVNRVKMPESQLAKDDALTPQTDPQSATSDELNSQVDVEVASNPSGPLEVLNTKDEPIDKASGLNARITTRFDPATETVSYGLERVNAAGKVLPFIGAPESFPTEQAARDYIVSALGEQEVKTDAPVSTKKQVKGETDPLMLFMANNKINLVPDIKTEGAIARRVSKGFRALDSDKNKVSNRKMAPTQADYNGNPVAQGRLSSISDRNSSNAMDVVAQSAFDRNLIAQPTVDALFDGIRSSLGKVGGEATITSAEMAQDAAENEQQSQQAAADKFFGGFTSPLRNDVTTPASLQIGDTLTVGDDVVTVIDKNDAGVTLESQNLPGEHFFDYEDSIGYDAINDSKGAEVDLDRRESLAKEGVVTADEAADLTKTIRENPSAGKNATAISSQDHTAYSRDSKELDVARRLANFFGLRIVGVSGLGGNAAVLRDDNKNIYLDVDADRAIIVLTAHELLHQMRQNARELYDKLLSTLRADPNYKQGLADYVAELRPEHRGKPMDLIEEEFLADYLMDQGAEPAFWEKLAQAEPGMFEELVEFIRKFLNDVRDFIKESKLGAAKYLKDADAMERAMVKALVEFRDSQELNAGWTTPGTGAVMESVVDDNMPFADRKTKAKAVGEVASSTSVGALTGHPDFNSAKYFGNVRAARDIVEQFVKQKAIDLVISQVNPSKPAVIIPVISREGDSLNMLPLAMAEKLSFHTGIPVWTKLAKVSNRGNTGASAADRSRTQHEWQGELPAYGVQIVLVDDTYTSGQTLRSLAEVAGEPAAIATIASGRYGKKYALPPELEEKLLYKAGLSKRQFVNLYGQQPRDILTGAQAQQYLLNGAKGREGIIARFPVDGRKRGDQGIAALERLPTGVTTFSGGGLVEIGLRGIVTPTVAVEYNPAIAQAYRAAFGDHVVVGDIRTTSMVEHRGKFHYHASPVCKNSSLLKSAAQGGVETDLDIESAEAVARHIDEIEPKVVTIENVSEYRNTRAAEIIREKLQKSGYIFDEGIYNAAEYGAPTSRKRYLLRAVKGGTLPTPIKKSGLGWYETVKDIIEQLPDDNISRAKYIYRSLSEQGIDPDNVTEPLLVSGTTLFKKVAVARASQPAFTFKATPATVDRILLPGGRVKRVTARAKARMTGIPDSYPLPADEKVALTIIGNGVPPALVRNVFGPLIEANKSDDIRFADRRIPKETVARHSELEAKHDAGTLTPEEEQEAGRIVEEAARGAGYGTEAWHYTNADIDDILTKETARTQSDIQGVFFMDRPDEYREYGNNEYHVYLKLENPTNYDTAYGGFRGDRYDAGIRQREKIQSEGFDSVVIPADETGMEYGEIIVFDSNQIKSADPFTGVPLDQRFNSEIVDMRFADYKGQVFGNEGVAESAKVQGFVDELIPKVKEDHFDGDYPVNPYQTDYAFKKLKALENGEIDLREQYGENGLNKDGANQVLIGELMQYAHRMMREDSDSSLYEALNDRANKAAKGEASAAGRVLNVRQWYTRQFDKASGVIREAKSEIIKKVYGKSGESEIEDVQDNLKTALEAVRELSPEGRKTVLAAVAKGRSDKATSLGEQMGTAISGKKKPGKAVAAVVEEALSFMESLDDIKFADWLGNDQEKVAIRDKIIREKITHGKRSWSQFKAGLMRVGYSEEFAKQAFVKASELHEKAKAAKAADIATSKAEKEEPSYAEQFLATSDAETAMTDRINAKAGKAIDAVNGTKKPRKPSTQSPDPIKQLVKDSLATGDNFNRLETIKAAIVLGFTDKSAREFADAVEARLANEKAKREAKTNPAKIAREISGRFNNPVDRPPSKKEPIRKLVRLALNQRSTVTESSFMAEMKTLGVPKLEAANLWGDIVKDRALREQMRDLKRKADAEHSGSSSEKEAQAIMQKLWNVPGKSNPRAKSTVEQFYDDELGYGKQRSLSDFVDGLTAVGVDKDTATRLYELATIERVNRLELAKQKKIAKVLATADGFKPSAGPITLKRQVKADKRTAASIEKEILNHPQLRIVGPEVRIQIQARIFRDRAGLSLVDAYAAAQEFDKDLQARWIEAGERVVEKVTTKRNAPFVRKERGKGAKKPSPTQFDALVKAIRAGALDPRKRVLDEVAKANGWIDLTPGALQRLAELDELIHGRGLTKPQIERLSELNLKERASELTDEEIAERKAFVDRQAEGLTGFEHVRLHRQMIEIYSSSSLPESVLKIIGQSITANIFSGPSTLLIGFSGTLEQVGAMTRDTALSVVGSTIGKKTSIAEVRNMTGMMQAMMRGKDYFQQAINDAMLTARTGETRSVVAEEITDSSDSLDRVWMRQKKVLDNPSASPSAKAKAMGAMVFTVGRFAYRALKTVDAFVKGVLGRYVKELELFSRAANLGWTSKQIKGLVNAVAANGEIYAAEADAKGFTGSDKRVYIEARTEESMLRAFRDEGIEVDDILNRSGREANLATGMGQIQDGSYTLGKVAQAAKWFRKEAPIAGPLMVPAVQTPYNVFHRGVWWTPFAIHRYLITAARTKDGKATWYNPGSYLKNAEDKWYKPDSYFKNWEDSSYQEALADPVQLALRATETALGTALFGGLAKLLFDQMGEDDEDKWLRVNLAGPSTSSRLERSAWLNAGNRPFALQFKTDKGLATLGFRRGGFEAFNFAMTVIGAAEQQKYEKWISSDSAWERYGLTLSKELLGESLFFMRGSTSRGVSMDSIGNEVGFRASSFVPLSSMWKTATRFDDMKEREAGFWGNFAMQMPLVGALSDRRPAINSLGQEVGFNETSNFYVQSKLNIPLGWVPSEAPDKTKTNPGYKDLLGLMHNKKAFVSAYSKSSFDSSLKRASTDAEFYDFLKLRGELSVEEMKKRYTSLWKMDKEEFKEELSNISTEATKQAKKKMGIKTR